MAIHMVRAVGYTTQNGVRLPLLMDAVLKDGYEDRIDYRTIRIFPLTFPEDKSAGIIEFGDAVVGKQFDNDIVPEMAIAAYELLTELIQQ